jgi:hypothetical protein
MRSMSNPRRGTIAAACVIATGLLALRMGAVPGERRLQDVGTAPAPIAISASPPKGAVVLFSGKADEIKTNFLQRYSNDPAGWTVDADGVATPNKHDITSKIEVKDCFLHCEFRCPADANGNPIGSGNSGVGFHGRYEVQILNSFGKKPEAHECGALYSQKAPIVIASKRPGEWQTFDIVFRAPRFDAADQATEKPRATVFQNGILIQNNEEFNGPTGIQYGQYKGMTKTGPILLQGDHDSVQFRNVWIVPN